MQAENLMLSAGRWIPNNHKPETGFPAIQRMLQNVGTPMTVVDVNGIPGIGIDGTLIIGQMPTHTPQGYPILAYVPPLPPEALGDPGFKARYQIKYAYVAGAMANGITSVRMVEAMGKAGMIGFFGAAGLLPAEIESAIHQIRQSLGDRPFGSNLIFSPNDPQLESATVDVYLKHKVRLVSASAFMAMTPALVRYRAKGMYRDASGKLIAGNRIVAKVSRIEVARNFLSPPKAQILNSLVDSGQITREQAQLAAQMPMADDVTAEADSGGHTDNRPAITLLPTLIALRDEMVRKYNYKDPIHVGLGGGIATPQSTAAAFAMGAAYVLTGSVNQSCVEAGTSETVRQMLCKATQPDITMAPSADMFELGVKVQVLKRGTMFPLRAAKLYDLYNKYNSLEEIPEPERKTLERDIFRCSFDQEWEQTRAFFLNREPGQIQRAEKDPKHKMALIFRSYLGRSSGWATTGDPTRMIDYQIWCGPAMGAFNQWVKGSFLENPENRDTVTVAMNLLVGASVVTRANWLRYQGVTLPGEVASYSPLPMDQITQLLNPKPNG